jgi:hypothetical protein
VILDREKKLKLWCPIEKVSRTQDLIYSTDGPDVLRGHSHHRQNVDSCAFHALELSVIRQETKQRSPSDMRDHAEFSDLPNTSHAANAFPLSN